MNNGKRSQGCARWEALLRQFPGSGLSVREFCRRRGLSEPSFYAWRRRLSVPAAPLFMPLRVAALQVQAGRAAEPASYGGGEPAEPGRIELLLAGGVTVRLFGEVPAARLASVLGVLGRHNGHDGKGGGPC